MDSGIQTYISIHVGGFRHTDLYSNTYAKVEYISTHCHQGSQENLDPVRGKCISIQLNDTWYTDAYECGCSIPILDTYNEVFMWFISV